MGPDWIPSNFGGNGHGSDVPLVPGVVRGFKMLRMHNGLLFSPVYNHLWILEGWDKSECSMSRVIDVKSPCQACARDVPRRIRTTGSPTVWVYDALCHHSGMSLDMNDSSNSSFSHQRTWRGGHIQQTLFLDCSSSCQQPELTCCCGFYAYYTPDLNVNNHTAFAMSTAVLAVVEAAGRIILGEYGFRAEKMRVIHYQVLDSSLEFAAQMMSVLDLYPPEDFTTLKGE